MNVLLIDEQGWVLPAVQAVIASTSSRATALGVDTLAEAHRVIERGQRFDLVLLDLSRGDAHGFELLAAVRRRYPALPVVVIAATERVADVVRAVDLGAMGFVPRTGSDADLHAALALVMSGGVFMPPSILGLAPRLPLPAPVLAPPPALARALPGPPPASPSTLPDSPLRGPGVEALGLTPRQADVLSLLLRGLSNKLIARELGLSVETVKDHVAAVLRALGVSSRTQAVLAVGQITLRERGLPGPPGPRAAA